MSYSTVNKIISLKDNENENKHDKKEQYNDENIQMKEEKDTLPENKFRTVVKHDDNLWIKIDDQPISTGLRDTIVDKENKEVQNRSKKNYPRCSVRKSQHAQQLKKSNHRKKTKHWAVFTLLFWGDHDDEDYKFDEDDDEVEDFYDPEFDDEIFDPFPRQTYLKIVLYIVGTMLTITTIILAVVYNEPYLYETFANSSWMLRIFTIVGLLFVYFSVLCCKAGRRAPCAYILLILTAVFVTIVAALVTCSLTTRVVIYGFANASAVALTCIGLSNIAFDFTSFWLYLIVISSGFSVSAMIIIIGMTVKRLHITFVYVIILMVSTTLQSLAFTMEIQMIVGGRSIEIHTDSYAVGAFMLYTSIIDIFIRILQLSGFTNTL